MQHHISANSSNNESGSNLGPVFCDFTRNLNATSGSFRFTPLSLYVAFNPCLITATGTALAAKMDTTVQGPDATNAPKAQVDDPSLRTIQLGVPDDEAIDAPIPEAQATTEERFKDYDTSGVTHVVIQ